MSTNGVPNVEVKNISKFFGSVIALKDVSMSVYAGEVMCLLGDNGAGKSTLIKTLAGVHQQSEGQYLVEGEEVLFDSPRRPGPGDCHRLPGSGHDSPDERLPQLLPRLRTDPGLGAVEAL